MAKLQVVDPVETGLDERLMTALELGSGRGRGGQVPGKHRQDTV